MKYVIVALTILFSAQVSAAEYYKTGKINNLTAVTRGIMITMDTGLPDNCEGAPYGWILIKQEHTALTSVVLAAWLAGKNTGSIYTSGRENGDGYCLATQFDPTN